MNPQSSLVFALVLGLAALLPAVLLMGTSFVKISVVLGSLRNAFGTPDMPGNIAVLGLSVVLTMHVMAPTAAAVYDAAHDPLSVAIAADVSTPAGAAAWGRTWQVARAPIVRFLRENARPSDRAFFVDLAQRSRTSQRMHGAAALDAPAADDVAVLLPAFVVSELTRAFLIAFLLLLPFLVVDVVVANVLVALGLHTMSPASVALPFKLLLFVMADGWHLLARALVLAYR